MKPNHTSIISNEKMSNRKLVSLSLAIVAGVFLGVQQAGAQTIEWSRSFNGVTASGLEETEGVVADASGNVFATGLSGNGSGSVICTMRLNSAGVIQWTRFDSKLSLCGGMWGRTPLVQDASGNLIVVGAEFTNNTSNWNPLFLKYNTSGTVLQRKVFNVGPYGSFDAVAVDGSGVFINAHNNPNNGNPHVVQTLKLDASGNVLWGDSFTPAVFWGTGNGVVATSSGVFTTGGNKFTKRDLTTGAILWQKDITMPGGGSALAADGAGNVFVMPYQNGLLEYDSAGNVLATLGNIASSASDFDVDAAGNIYVTGGTVSSKSGSDIFTQKFGPTGNLIWNATFGKNGPYSDQGIAISVRNGHVYVGGNTYNKNLDMCVLSYKAGN